MDQQVYQKEETQDEKNFQFYDPETKRIRGFLSEKAYLDNNNRKIEQNGLIVQIQNTNNIHSQCVNSININSNINNYFNNNKTINSNNVINENELDYFYPKNNLFIESKKSDDQSTKRSSTIDLESAQSFTQAINQMNNKQIVSENIIDSQFNNNFDELMIQSQKSLSQGLSLMTDDYTPTEFQQKHTSQNYSQSTPELQNKASCESAEQKSSLPNVNNENIYFSESKSNASGSKYKSSGKKYNDRYIPNRISTNLYNLMSPTSTTFSQGANQSTNGEETEDGVVRRYADNPRQEQNSKLYSNLLQSSILGESPELFSQSRNCLTSHSNYMPKDSTYVKYGQSQIYNLQKSKKLLTYSSKQQTQNYEYELKNVAHNSIVLSHEQTVRKIPKQPYKVLESRNLQDDFYLNLLDWSPMNYLAVGLKNQVVIWSGCNSTISRLSGLGDVGVSSVSCSQRSNHIAVGDSIGNVLIYDFQHKDKPLLKIDGHQDRIGSIAWNGSLIASGSKDKSILVRDLRAPQNIIQKFSGHKQEICGLKWSFDENILASGGNDNKLFLWTIKGKEELAKFSQHTAAVKALGFSPHQHNILASGGGTADRCIRFWNTQTLQQIDCLDTGSQVCNLMFSKNVNEIVSTHGYSLNQIIVWKYPSMKKMQTLTGHTQRVLYLAMSPCGQNVVTGAGDETLRFWSIFPSLKNKSNILGTSSLFPSCIDLR